MRKRHKRIALRIARVCIGVFAAAATLTTIAFYSVLNVPHVNASIAATTVERSGETESRLACVGSFTELGVDATQASTQMDVGSPTVTVQPNAATADLQPIVRKTTTQSMDAVAAPTPQPTNQPAPPPNVSTSWPVGVLRTGVGQSQTAAAQSQEIATERIRGFDASVCTETGPEHWLVAGGTGDGATSILVLTNPGEVSATVTVTVFSEVGKRDTPGSKGITVEGGTQRRISLNGFVPDATATIVHVSARGGTISAALQHSQSEALEATGVDTAASAPAPATNLTIPGVRMYTQPGVQVVDEHGHEEDVRILRVMNTGSINTTVEAVAHASTGEQLPLGRLDCAPNLVNELELPPLDPGAYTITLHASQPIVAGVRVVTIGSTGFDLAWFSAAQPFENPTGVAVAAGGNPLLSLHNPGETEVSVNIEPETGGTTQQRIPAGETRTITVAPNSRALLTPSGPVTAAVSYAADGALSGYPVQAERPAQQAITVVTR